MWGLMDRAKATRQIERIIQAIENEQFPAAVKELHVFGSYARGALDPGDLDLMVVHDPPSPDLLNLLRQKIVEKYGEQVYRWPGGVSPEWRFESSMRAAMRKPGEKMDILLGTSMEQIAAMGRNIATAHRVLLWTESDRDWKAKLTAIKPDPSAGRQVRAHFGEVKRFRTDVRAMLNVTEAISQNYLKLTRINADTTDAILNPLYEYWYDHWVKCKVMGKDSMKLLRHGMWWMQQQRGQMWQRPHSPRNDGILCSDGGKYAVYFGVPPVYAVWRLFSDEYRCTRICLLPHFKRGQLNEMFVFERGRKKGVKAFAAIMNRL